MTRTDVAEQLLTHRDARRRAVLSAGLHAGLHAAGLDAWRMRPRPSTTGTVSPSRTSRTRRAGV